MPGAGKSSVVEILKKKRLRTIEMREPIIDMMRKEKLRVTNRSTREFSTEMRKRNGNDIVARLVVEKINREYGGGTGRDLVIAGVRGTSEIRVFRKVFNGKMVVVNVSAPVKTRFMRLKTRGREDDPKTLRGFEYRERTETGWGLSEAIKEADYIILNTGSMQDLRNNVEEFMKTVKSG